MQESDLKTSTKQRVFIAIIAALMLGASVAIYIAIILSAGTAAEESAVNDALVAEYQAEYDEKNASLEEMSSSMTEKYYGKLTDYRSKIKGFNASNANASDVVKTEDLKIGSGEKLTAESTGYGAYYVGWCSDETVFDSSFDNYDEPTTLKQPLVVEEESLIEGWYLGVAGMHLGGARIVTIPGALAYGDSYNPCDSESEEKNVPLKFLIMPVELTDDYKKLAEEVNTLQMKLLYAQYGLEYTE